jgi:hypothetical protein
LIFAWRGDSRSAAPVCSGAPPVGGEASVVRGGDPGGGGTVPAVALAAGSPPLIEGGEDVPAVSPAIFGMASSAGGDADDAAAVPSSSSLSLPCVFPAALSSSDSISTTQRDAPGGDAPGGLFQYPLGEAIIPNTLTSTTGSEERRRGLIVDGRLSDSVRNLRQWVDKLSHYKAL